MHTHTHTHTHELFQEPEVHALVVYDDKDGMFDQGYDLLNSDSHGG